MNPDLFDLMILIGRYAANEVEFNKTGVINNVYIGDVSIISINMFEGLLRDRGKYLSKDSQYIYPTF